MMILVALSFFRLLITFADQDRQNVGPDFVGPDLDPNCLTL